MNDIIRQKYKNGCFTRAKTALAALVFALAASSVQFACAEDQVVLGSDDWNFAMAKNIAVDFADAGMWARAGAYLDDVGEKTQDWNVLLMWARVKVQLGEMEKADHAIKLALKQAPSNPRILFTAGDIALDLKQLDEAELYYEQALAIQPDQAKAALALGRLYARNNEWQKLIPVYERLASTTLAPSEVWIRLAVAHEQAGNLPRSEYCYRQYAELSRNKSVGLSHLHAFYERTGQSSKAAETRRTIHSLGKKDGRVMRALHPSSR